MGLKTTNYTVWELGITLDNAYAKVQSINLDKSGNAKALIAIQQSREATETLEPLELHEVNFVADKTLPIYEQAYIAAKANGFNQWTDDIITPEGDVL